MHDVARGRHPTLELEQLRDGWDATPAAAIPPEVFGYIRQRLAGLPPGRPARGYDDVALYGRFPECASEAYMEFLHLYDEFLAIGETTAPGKLRTIALEALLDEDCEPTPVRVEFIEVKARGTWRVANAKAQARSIVARRHFITPDLLEKFGREFTRDDSWLGQIF